MFIDISKNNGKDYLRLTKSNRVKNNKGIKVARNTVIYNIGPLDKFDDGKPKTSVTICRFRPFVFFPHLCRVLLTRKLFLRFESQ